MALDTPIQVKPRTLVVLAVVAASLYLLYTSAASITGFQLRASALEASLNETKGEFHRIAEEKSQCEGFLGTMNRSLAHYETGAALLGGALGECRNRTTALDKELVVCTAATATAQDESKASHAALGACETANANLSERMQASGIYHLKIIKGAVRSVCCRPGIAAVTWDIGSEIICSGPYSMNCTSGETNYTVVF
ncbi:MAG: hypothetical protein HYY37_04100 [Candidatus Aenigmarchaeota archaeon]|nr:hypothetical protein [Candidatus Aenigmarchaeota archaeon]